MTTISHMHWKDYMVNHGIPQTFESILSGLMIDRPDDPLNYIEQRIIDIQEVGIEKVDWTSFIKLKHPQRDPVLREIVHDGSEFDKEWQDEQEAINEELSKMSKASKTSNENINGNNDTVNIVGMYESDVFSLTETLVDPAGLGEAVGSLMIGGSGIRGEAAGLTSGSCVGSSNLVGQVGSGKLVGKVGSG